MKIVIALGGNALGNSPKEQLELVKETAKPLVDLIEQGHDLIVAHGNGPQVGMIFNGLQTSHQVRQSPVIPLAECGAMSQGYIGYHLQNALKEELQSRAIAKEVVSLVTQVEVDANDPAFTNPTKPIGGFMSLDEAKAMEATYGYPYVEDSGRGYRRVVASPKPKGVVEAKVIQTLVKAGVLVVTVGGGGIPVVAKGHGYEGVDAVIDKDFASAALASIIDADLLIILTAVDRVMIRYNTPQQEAIAEMNIALAKQYIQEGHFAPGSMLPKVEAAIRFVSASPNKTAIIASLEKAKEAIQGTTGTKIVA
jgi:carbamate kinase